MRRAGGLAAARPAQSQEAMDAFVSVMASKLPAPEFFSPESVGRIMAAASA